MIPSLSKMRRVKKNSFPLEISPFKMKSWRGFDFLRSEGNRMGLDKIDHPLLHHLLSLDPRIKLYREIGDDAIGFEILKREIRIACVFPRASHEVAHWVEMEDKDRWILPNWGLKTYVPKTQSDAVFLRGFSREIRVRALETFLGMKKTPFNDELRRNLEDRMPTTKFKKQQDILDWQEELAERTKKHWSADRIENEFKLRLDLAREFMETRKPI